MLEALQGQTPSDLAATLRGLIVAANGQPELAGVFSTYAADTPQIYLDIDRDKAQVLGVKITDIFNALQSSFSDVDGRLTTKPDSASRATINRDRLTIIRLNACTTLPTRSPDRVMTSVDRSQ